MKLRNLIVVTAVGLLSVPIAATAATPSPMKAGKWEITVQADMPGMQVPPRTFTKCVTKEESENVENAIPKMRDQSGCKLSDVKVDGNTVSWKIACEASQTTGEGKMTYDNDSYSGEVHIKTPEHEMTMKHSGKRVGDCDK